MIYQFKPLYQIFPSCSGKTHSVPAIYALVDPKERNIVRYVGRSSSPSHRFYDNLHAKRGITMKWINSLRAEKIEPEMWIIEEGDSGKREWFWIQYFRNPKLITNHTSLASCNYCPFA